MTDLRADLVAVLSRVADPRAQHSPTDTRERLVQMIEQPKNHESGSGSPTTQALIAFLERWAKDFPLATELRAAADALRSLEAKRAEQHMRACDLTSDKMDLEQRLAAAEAEVARLTTALHDESRSPDGDGQDTNAPRLDGWDVQAANGGAPHVPDLASQTPLTTQEEARAASDVASPMRRRSIAGSEPADSLSPLRAEVARLTPQLETEKSLSELRRKTNEHYLRHFQELAACIEDDKPEAADHIASLVSVLKFKLNQCTELAGEVARLTQARDKQLEANQEAYFNCINCDGGLTKETWKWLGPHVGPFCDRCVTAARGAADDEPSVLGAGAGVSPMPTRDEAEVVWRAAYIARMVARGVDRADAQACCAASDMDLSTDPVDAADDELSAWTNDEETPR